MIELLFYHLFFLLLIPNTLSHSTFRSPIGSPRLPCTFFPFFFLPPHSFPPFFFFSILNHKESTYPSVFISSFIILLFFPFCDYYLLDQWIVLHIFVELFLKFFPSQIGIQQS